MDETKDDPTFIVRLTGILSPEDIERYEQWFSEKLPGRVVVVDNRVDDVYKVTDKMQPRDAIITVHHKQVPAKVWPVAVTEDEMLVEWEDGTLGAAKLWDIRMVSS